MIPISYVTESANYCVVLSWDQHLTVGPYSLGQVWKKIGGLPGGFLEELQEA